MLDIIWKYILIFLYSWNSLCKLKPHPMLALQSIKHFFQVFSKFQHRLINVGCYFITWLRCLKAANQFTGTCRVVWCNIDKKTFNIIQLRRMDVYLLQLILWKMESSSIAISLPLDVCWHFRWDDLLFAISSCLKC